MPHNFLRGMNWNVKLEHKVVDNVINHPRGRDRIEGDMEDRMGGILN